MLMRTATTALTAPLLLTACGGEPPAAKAPPPAAETPTVAAEPALDPATLPGLTVTGDGTTYADGVVGWTVTQGTGTPLDPAAEAAVLRVRAWTMDGRQFFGDDLTWDELVLPTTNSNAFDGWSAALTDMEVGEVRKVWIDATDRQAWPVQGQPAQDAVLDIELVKAVTPADAELPGAAVGDASRRGSSSGLRWYDLSMPAGAPLQNGDSALVSMVVWLDDGTRWKDTGGTPVRLSVDEALMPALREGLVGMTPGSSRKLIVPAELGAGFDPMGELPAGSTLIVDMNYVGDVTGNASASASTPGQ
ncbi:MAG: FKBP-type peptidyl-prolyl cis-trans isomerase [Phycisphaerales bacterium]|jgi:hypothetical protein|nr:FKBP-type peptidyl-prolyl cis-trans isomerase [Phycisphaerales bacterium]